MKIYLRNTDQGLIPLYNSDYEEKKKLKLGIDYEVEIKKARNYLFHKKFFALLKLAYDNLPEHLHEKYTDFECFRAAVEISCGHAEFIFLPDGRSAFKAKSICFDEMDGIAFHDFYNKAVNVILQYFLKGTTNSEIEEMIAVYF